MFNVKAFLKDKQLSDDSSLTVTSLMGGYWNEVYRVKSDSFDWVLKRFSIEPERVRLFPNLPESEALALKTLQASGTVASFVAYFAPTTGEPAVLIYDFARGDLWKGDITRVATLMKQYHDIRIDEPIFRQLPCRPQEILEQAEVLLSDCLQDAHVKSLKDYKPTIPDDFTDLGQLSLVHTDAWVGNFIGEADALVLIDWQCPGMGDPAEDVWTFLYSGFQKLIGLPDYSLEEQEAFLVAYADDALRDRLTMLAPFYAYRVAAHSIMRLQDLKEENPNGSKAYELVLNDLMETLL